MPGENKKITKPGRKLWFGIDRKFTIIFLVFIIAPVIILGSVMIEISSRSIEEKLKTFTVESLEQMGQNMDSQIQTLDSIASSVLSNEDVMKNIQQYSAMDSLQKRNAEHQIRTWLTGLSDLNMEVSGVYLFDRSNNFFYTKGRSPTLGYNVVQQDWYKKTIERDGALKIFGTHEQFHVSRQPEMVVTITRALKDFISQKPIGVIMLDIPYQFLESVFKGGERRLSEGTGTYVLDTDGKILYSHKSEELFSNFPQALHSQMNEGSGMLQSGSSEISKGVEENNKSFVVYYTSPYTGWRIVSIQPKSEVLKEIDRVKQFFVLMITVFVVIFVLCLFYVKRKLIVPIKDMSLATGKVKAGDYSVELDYPNHDEITVLAEGLTSMAGHIEALINKVYLSQLLQKEAEITALQHQINPHFLYNSLECVRGMALESGNSEVVKMVKALSAYTRYNIVNSRDLVTVQDEVKQIRNYMTIQNTRHDGKFKVVYNIPEAFMGVKIMKLTLQPLVENSIKHGLEGRLGKGIISISMEEDFDDFIIRVSDNGVGMEAAEIEQMNSNLKNSMPVNPEATGEHIGVINVHTRIGLYFGERYGLHYEQVKGGGLSVTIRLPKKGA